MVGSSPDLNAEYAVEWPPHVFPWTEVADCRGGGLDFEDCSMMRCAFLKCKYLDDDHIRLTAL